MLKDMKSPKDRRACGSPPTNSQSAMLTVEIEQALAEEVLPSYDTITIS